MRSHRRREPLEHVLVAGDVDEIDSVRALLALLPETAYGQVLVETEPGRAVPSVLAPARVTVTTVVRDATAPRGSAVTLALAAWVAEWLPEEPEPGREVSVWLGVDAREEMPALALRLDRFSSAARLSDDWASPS